MPVALNESLKRAASDVFQLPADVVSMRPAVEGWMGFNIEHGFRLHCSDLGGVDALLRRFRDVLKPLHRRAVAVVYGGIAVNHIDRARYGHLLAGDPSHEIKDPIVKAWAELVERAGAFVTAFGVENASTHARGRLVAFALDGRFMDPGIDDLIGDGGARFLMEASAMDRLALVGGRDAAARPMSSAWNEVNEREAKIRRTGYRDPELDFGFDVSLVLQAGRVYGIMHCERADWRQLWLRQPEVEAYPWWDNEPPDGFSQDAWTARGADWKAALGPATVPSLVGMSASLTDSIQGRLMKDDLSVVLAESPSFEQRLARAAETVLRDRATRSVMSAAPPPSYSEGIRRVIEVNDWMRSPDGTRALAAAAADVEPLLARELTLDMLLNGAPAACPGGSPQAPR